MTDPFAGMPFPFTAPDAVGKIRHLIEDRMHLRHHILTVDHDRRLTRGAKRAVEHGPIFGHIDLVASEHRLDTLVKPGFLRQLYEELDCVIRNTVLRVVQEQSFCLGSHASATRRIISKKRSKMYRPALLVLTLYLLPGLTPMKWFDPRRLSRRFPCCRGHSHCSSPNALLLIPFQLRSLNRHGSHPHDESRSTVVSPVGTEYVHSPMHSGSQCST